jgi:high-affinity Fe2+/Pb2+ permease
VRLPRWLSLAAVAGFFGLGSWSFADMASADARGGIMGGMPRGPGGLPGGPQGPQP